MVAACVRLPSVWLSVSRIRSRSTSSMRRPTSDATPAAPVSLRRPRGVGRGGAGDLDRLRLDLVSLREQHGAVHHVLELAHIAAPAMRGEPQMRGRDSGRGGRPFTSA